MTQQQLEKKVKYWQNVLKLDHWDISCELVHSEDINKNLGRCNAQQEYFTAHIRIQNPKHYRFRKDEHEMEFEKTIIHELLHCHTAGMTDGTRNKELIKNEERCVTLLSRAFYDLWAGEAI